MTACATQEDAAEGDGTWVGTITAEGNVTTVVNEAGSVWGGTGRLVEEVSIGVDIGPLEYMLGGPGGLFATDSEIYVADPQVPTVRVYDWEGTYIRDFGRQGQGPGEYSRPGGVIVADDGLVYIGDAGAMGRITVFSAEGESLDTWTFSVSDSMQIFGSQSVLRHDGAIFVRASWYPPGEARDRDARRTGWQQVGPQGLIGEPLEQPDLGVERPAIPIGRGAIIVPYSPSQVSAFSPAGAYIVGNNSDYSFEIRHDDGRIVKVHRHWTPVPITEVEREYSKRSVASSAHRSGAGSSWTYSGPDIPDHKPAYSVFSPTQDSRVMVSRYGASHLVEGCDLTFDLAERPTQTCFTFERFWDMFDLDGMYLGEVERPDVPALYTPFWRGDTMWAMVEDDAGVMKVKRYRLVLPGGESTR